MLRLIAIAFLTTFVAISQLLAQKTETKKRLSPVRAFALSLVPIVSGGQFYNGEYKKGLTMVGVQGAGILIAAISCPNVHRCGGSDKKKSDRGGVIFFLGYLWALMDAPVSANRINKNQRQEHLLKFERNQVALGVDPVVLRDGKGVRLTFHF